MTAELNWHDERLSLLPERAIWWERRKTLIIADAHFGKPAAFRLAGSPAPETVTDADLERLSTLVRSREARRLIALGDLFHSPEGHEADATRTRLLSWREGHRGLAIELVLGNHDRRVDEIARLLDIRILDESAAEEPFHLRHDPIDDPTSPTLAGHLHPVVRLTAPTGAGVAGLRAPCFWVRPLILILPSFGSFTGGYRIQPRSGDRIFAVGPDAVVECATTLRRRSRSRA
ncbi:MAG: ligase-associated DNA damage response endonuclease PdeM [Phycisphaerales bacterium]